MSNFVGYERILVGDFNFECSLSSAGFTEFSKFMNEYHLVCYDNSDSSKCGFTYYHEGLDQRSLIDHAFVSCGLRSRIKEYRIIFDGANLSDRLPVTFKLCLTIVRHPVSNPHRRTVKQLRWDKGDTDTYYYESGLMLSKIQHDWLCEHADKCDYCCNASCQHDLDVFYSEIIHGLREAAKSCIPEIPASALKHY